MGQNTKVRVVIIYKNDCVKVKLAQLNGTPLPPTYFWCPLRNDKWTEREVHRLCKVEVTLLQMAKSA